MAANGEGGGDPAAARRRWDLTNKGTESIPMVREAVEMSTDEESDGVIICPPNGNTDDCEGVISSSHHDGCPESQVTCVKDSDMDGADTQEDKRVNQDSLKLIDQEKSAPPKSPTKSSISGTERSKHTVPQPFALSTQRMFSGGGHGGVVHPSSNRERSGDKSNSSPASLIKKSTPMTPKKTLQPDHTFHPQEEDSCSVTSSAGKTKTTVAAAPSFVCGDRADKRKEFYQKLEEKHKALEAEKSQAKARKQKLGACGFGVMGDTKPRGEDGPRCVGCGRRVKTLFVQYSPGNIRLMKCDNCKAVADPYIECEFMIILIDLILHKTRAYRHLLFNKLSIDSSLDKGILYLSILMHIVLDTISFSKGNKADTDSSRSMLSTIFNCIEVLGDALLGNIIFMSMLILGVRFILKISFDITRYREVLLAVIISSYFKLFLITMMVWEFPSSAIFVVEIFVLSSNVVALIVVTQFSKAHCFGVCFMAHVAKFLTERWLLRTP